MLDRLLHFVTGSPAFQFLRSVTPFDFLPDAELERLADALCIEYHPRGSTLLVQAQSAVKDLHVVVKGALELARRRGARRARSRAHVGLGQTYGGACLLTNGGVAFSPCVPWRTPSSMPCPGRSSSRPARGTAAFHDFFAGSPGPRLLERVGASLRQRWLLASPDPGRGRLQPHRRRVCDRDVAWCAARSRSATSRSA